jgi:hypothetical protein
MEVADARGAPRSRMAASATVNTPAHTVNAGFTRNVPPAGRTRVRPHVPPTPPNPLLSPRATGTVAPARPKRGRQPSTKSGEETSGRSHPTNEGGLFYGPSRGNAEAAIALRCRSCRISLPPPDRSFTIRLGRICPTQVRPFLRYASGNPSAVYRTSSRYKGHAGRVLYPLGVTIVSRSGFRTTAPHKDIVRN